MHLQKNILYLKVITFKPVLHKISNLLDLQNYWLPAVSWCIKEFCTLKSIHYGWDYFYFKGNLHLLSWHRKGSCIQWCLEWAAAWIEDFWRCSALGKQQHSLPQGEQEHSLGGWNDADFSNMGKDVWFQLHSFLCVCGKNQWYISKDDEIWLRAQCGLLYHCCCSSKWTVIYVSQCKKQSLVCVLKRNCYVKWRINFILGVVNRAQKKLVMRQLVAVGTCRLLVNVYRH